MSVCRQLLCLLGLILGTGFASENRAEQADDSALIQLRSQHALNALFGLPGVAARPVRSREWQVSLEHGNQFIGARVEGESLMLDGETSELTLRLRQPLGSCWQGELILPFLQHSRGKFDRSIDSWHQFFGMPDAGRDEYPYGQLTYRYSDRFSDKLLVDTAQSGIGDISVSVQRTLACRARTDIIESEPIVRLGLKLPTGSVTELRGSGRADVYADVQSPIWGLGDRWRAGASIGLLYVGENLQLAPQRAGVVFGAAGAQYRLSQRYRIMMQLDWHTAFYRSALAALNDPTVVITAGLRYVASSKQALELTISEDIAVETAPDIVARLAWVYRPALKR